YNDARAKAEAAALESLAGGAEALASRAVNWKGALALPPKLRWLLDHEPGAVAQAAQMLLGAHDFVALRLCGARATDAVTASTTGLLGPDGGYCLELLRALLPVICQWTSRLCCLPSSAPTRSSGTCRPLPPRRWACLPCPACRCSTAAGTPARRPAAWAPGCLARPTPTWAPPAGSP
ncbi:unnamed protein product, partial [Prorocentrum cordatum]